MKITILSINYWPESTGIGAFTTYRAEYLADHGHVVCVCTTFPYYPGWKVLEGYRGKLAINEEHCKVKILRSYSYIPNPVKTIKRVLHEGSYVVSSFLSALLGGRPDLLLVVSPPLGLSLSAIVLSKLWKIPFVFDVEDIQPDSAGDLNMLPKWIVNCLYKLERVAYMKASMVTTLTSGMRNKILSKGILEDKVEIIEPRMDESLLSVGPQDEMQFREKYGLKKKFIVVHSGNMGVKQGLDVVADAAMLSRFDDSIVYLLVGDGADRDRVFRRVTGMKVDNVRFLPLLGDEDYRGLLSTSGVCLVTQKRAVSEIAFPSKIVSYFSAGCPVIASVNANSEVARAVQESGAGFVVEAENGSALHDAVMKIKTSKRNELSKMARSYACRRWAAQRVLGHMEKCLMRVVASSKR